MLKRLVIIVIILLSGSLVFAQDLTIDSDGKVGIGTPIPSARLEVEGLINDDGVASYTSGTGISVYGENSTSGNFGFLGDLGYGVYGYSISGYAGYFQGDMRVTGNLTVDGLIKSST